ncbi:MAG: peptidase domain-containing ABC transporter [Fimbriiglobus sp.]
MARDVVEIPAETPNRGMVAVLEVLARSIDLPFDITKATQAVRTAVREIAPTRARAARLRLSEAATALGIQLGSRQLSVKEAISYTAYGSPLAIYTVTPQGFAKWFVLLEGRGGQGKLDDMETVEIEGWQKAEDIARLLGAVDADAVLEWVVGSPTTPMNEATTYYDRTQQSGHGHGHEDIHNTHDHGQSAHSGHGHGGHGHSHISPERRLFQLLKPETWPIMMVCLYAIGVGVLTLATPIVVMAVVNSVALVTVGQQLMVLCLMLFVALAFAGVISTLQKIVVEYIQRRVFVRVAEDLSFRLPRVEHKSFDQQSGPELVNRFFDVITVQKASATLLLDGVAIVLQILIGLILLGYYNELLLGFDMILILSLGVLFTLLGWGGKRSAIRESIAKYAVVGWLQEIARNPSAFKGHGGTQFATEKTDLLTREYLVARRSHFGVLMRQFVFAVFLQAATNVGLLAVGGYLVIENRLTIGELVAAEIVVTLVVATFTKLNKQVESYYDLIAGIDKLGHLVDLPLERMGGVVHNPRSSGAEVILHDVTFNYDTSHRAVLSHLNMHFRPGERVAIMGPNGAGKSTLAQILHGLRNPADGWVEIDGHDVRELRLESLREHVELVQDIDVFEGSLLANVRMGREDITIGDVREALRKVGLLDAVMQLPQGLNTMLWTGGTPLSLGQANRLMIARAIVGQPRLLILDEALDNMDSDIRETVLPAILGREARWTLIVVTHSEEVAKLCDRVERIERAALTAHAEH